MNKKEFIKIYNQVLNSEDYQAEDFANFLDDCNYLLQKEAITTKEAYDKITERFKSYKTISDKKAVENLWDACKLHKCSYNDRGNITIPIPDFVLNIEPKHPNRKTRPKKTIEYSGCSFLVDMYKYIETDYLYGDSVRFIWLGNNHPHAHDNESFCFGDADPELIRLLKNHRYTEAFDLAIGVAQRHNPLDMSVSFSELG